MIAVALSLILAPSPQTIDVSGQVKLSNGRNAGLAAVWLEGSAKAKPLLNQKIDQRNRAFEPHVAIVTVGTRINFPNNDDVLHNVFANYNAAEFDLGSYPRGASASKVFEKKGLVVLLCNMHSEMGAFVIVVDTPYYAVADKQGRFEVKNVPPGKYTVHGWHESNQVFEQEMTVSSGKPLDLSLARKKRK